MESIVPGTHSYRKVQAARRFFDGNAASYDLVVHLWTLGLDRFWKRQIIAGIPPSPRRLIDQACGTGILTLRLARRFPECLVFGVDLNREYLAMAERKAGASALGKNVAFIQGRAEDVFLKGPFDCIASSYLAKYADLEKLVDTAARMLRRGGVLAMHDFTYPENPFARFFLGVYFRIMQTVGSHAFPRWNAAFYELEDFLKQSRWVPELAAALETHGFGRIRARRFTLGCAAVVSAVRQ